MKEPPNTDPLAKARELGRQRIAELVLRANHEKAGLGNQLLDLSTFSTDIWVLFVGRHKSLPATKAQMEQALSGLGEIALAFAEAEIPETNVWVILDFMFTKRPDLGNRSPIEVWRTDEASRQQVLTIARHYGKRGAIPRQPA